MATFTVLSARLQLRRGHSVASHTGLRCNAQPHCLRAATAAAVQSASRQLQGRRQFCYRLSSAARTARRGQHAAKLQAPVAAAGKAVDFKVPEQPLAFGENLKLVGSVPELGSWEPESAPTLEWGEGNNWTSAVSLPAGAVEFKVVVVRGDGSFWWEETANRTIEVPEGGSLSVTCHMGGEGATEAHDKEGADMQTPESDAEASAAEAAVEDESAELVEEQIGGQEAVQQAKAEVQHPEEPPAPTGDDLETPAGGSGGAVAAEPVQGSEGAVNAHSEGPALAKGDGQFLGRDDIEVHDDGSITFSLDPADDGVRTLAEDIMRQLQDS